MKYSILLLSIKLLYCFSSVNAQTQIGNDVIGDNDFDRFGQSIDINSNGSTFIVGARTHDGNGLNSGTVRIFEDSSGNWVQKGIDLGGDSIEDEFGTSVAMNGDGNTIIIGAPYSDLNVSTSGSFKVFEWDSIQWVQKGNTIGGLRNSDRLGHFVDINKSGDIIGVVQYSPNSALVFIYEWVNNAWIRKGPAITSTLFYDETGFAISLNAAGNRIAVSSTLGTGGALNSGIVRVFEWSGTAWNQMGATINGSIANEKFGSSLKLNGTGNRLAIGASDSDVGGNDAGYVKVYEWNGTSWLQLGQTLNGNVNSLLGTSVTLNDSGNVLITGAPADNNSAGITGSTKVYFLQNSSWIQTGLNIVGQTLGCGSGFSIASDSAGSRITVSSLYYQTGPNIYPGNARVFDIRQIVGIDQISQSKAFEARVYPNPFYEAFKVDLGEKSNGNIEVRDISGKVVYETDFSSTSLLNLSPNIRSGIYFLDIRLQSGERTIKKMIKQ